MMRHFRPLLSAFLVVIAFLASGQNGNLRIVDNRTGNPVAFAHMKATEPGSKTSRFFVSDFDGDRKSVV